LLDRQFPLRNDERSRSGIRFGSRFERLQLADCTIFCGMFGAIGRRSCEANLRLLTCDFRLRRITGCDKRRRIDEKQRSTGLNLGARSEPHFLKNSHNTSPDFDSANDLGHSREVRVFDHIVMGRERNGYRRRGRRLKLIPLATSGYGKYDQC